MGKKDTSAQVTLVACSGCKKRCCTHVSDLEKLLKKERKRRKKLEKQLSRHRKN